MQKKKQLPKSDELYMAIINDMYFILFEACDSKVKISIKKFLDVNKDIPEINNKIYLLKLYLSDEDLHKNKDETIIHLTLNYILYIEYSLKHYDFKNVQFIEDFCLAYLALVCFRFIYVINRQNEQFLSFDLTFFDNYSALIENYQITVKIKAFYEKKAFPLSNKENKYIELLKIFDINKIISLKNGQEEEKINQNNKKEPLDSKKEEIKQNNFNQNRNDSIPKNNNLNNNNSQINISNIKDINGNKKEITNEKNLAKESAEHTKDLNKYNNNKKNNNSQNIKENKMKSNKTKVDNNKSKNINIMKKKEIETNILKNDKNNSNIDNSTKEKEAENSSIIKRLEALELSNKELQLSNKELQLSNIEIQLSNIKLEFKWLETNEKLCIQSIINSLFLNADKIKINYLDSVICSLKNLITKLSNPYNFNLWRKISNIILKNIFIILKINKFTIFQNVSDKLCNKLLSEANHKEINDIKSFKKKVNEYQKMTNDKVKISTKNISPAADKERQFNLITIYLNDKPEITASLSIDFLFYLKEMGNEINHFDEKVLNLILFDNLKIKEEIVEIKEEEEKVDISKNDNYNLNIIYTGKTEFTGNELINFLENPLKYQKKDENITDKFKFIYGKIEDFKNYVGYKDNNTQISELENEGKNIFLKIRQLLNNLETYFKNNNIDINDLEKINNYEKIDLDMKKRIIKYSDLKGLENNANTKLILYENIKERNENLNISMSDKEKKINEQIEEIKNGIDNVAKLIKMNDILQNYKDNLLTKIRSEMEYKNKKEIFNEANIKNFTIAKFYSFLRKYLNSENYKFSIIKRDITNYNLYAAIIEKFHELKDIYKDDCDIAI